MRQTLGASALLIALSTALAAAPAAQAAVPILAAGQASDGGPQGIGIPPGGCYGPWLVKVTVDPATASGTVDAVHIITAYGAPVLAPPSTHCFVAQGVLPAGTCAIDADGNVSCEETVTVQSCTGKGKKETCTETVHVVEVLRLGADGSFAWFGGQSRGLSGTLTRLT